MDQGRLIKAKELAKKDNENTIITTIGVRKEKSLHQIIKYYIEEDISFHEIPVGRMFADVKKDDHIYEIQTQHFNVMRNKLNTFLPKYKVTIVYPIAYIKTINLIDEYGEVKTRKSPKKGSPFLLFIELYKIKHFLKDPNLSFKILMLNMDEYRLKVPKERFHSKGFHKDDQVPEEIINEYDLYNKNNYIELLNLYPALFDKAFSTKDFAKITKISIKASQVVLNVLHYLTIVNRVDKQGNAFLYEISNYE